MSGVYWISPDKTKVVNMNYFKYLKSSDGTHELVITGTGSSPDRFISLSDQEYADFISLFDIQTYPYTNPHPTIQ